MKNITTIINIKNIYNKCERLSTVLSSNSFSSKSSIFGVRVSEAIITTLEPRYNDRTPRYNEAFSLPQS